MKKLLLLGALFFIQHSMAVAPYGIKGQKQTGTLYSNVHVFPENQVSNLGGINALVETGNVNLFVNANFEASPDFSGHTNTGTGTFVMETNAASLLEGNKTGKFQCAPTTVCSSSQTQAIKAGQSNLPAMISIVAEAGGADVEFCAVVDSAEVACIPVTTKGNYKIPVVTGTTNLGYILRQKSTASPLTIRYDQVKAEIKDTTEIAPIVGPRVSYTPTFTAFGTISNVNCGYSQVGPKVLIDCTFTSTAGSASEARVSLPSGLSIPTSQPSLFKAGELATTETTFYYPVVLAEQGASYLTFGYSTSASGSGSLAKRNGNALVSTTSTISFTAIVPIAQYASSVPVYYDRCKDPRNCETVFSLESSSAGVASKISTTSSTPWASCSKVSTGLYDCSVSALNNTLPMNCQPASLQYVNSTVIVPTGTSATNVRINTFDSTAETDTDSAFTLICQRQGQDYENAKVNQIVGSFKDYVKARSVTGNTRQIKVRFGGNATCSTACTTGTCTVCAGGAGDFTSITHAGLGTYRINGVNGLNYQCTFNGISSTSTITAGTSKVLASQTSSYHEFFSYDYLGGSLNSYGIVDCLGYE